MKRGTFSFFSFPPSSLLFSATKFRHLFLVALLFAFCIPVVPQETIDGVVVTGDVTNLVLCNRQGDTWIYKISIKLQAMNVGAEPVIISGADAITDYYKFANTRAALEAKEYAHIGWVNSGPGDPKSVPSRPVKPFRVVPPKGSIDINVDVGAIVIGGIKPGTTYIQIVAENWPGYSEGYVEKIRRAWKSHGTLWAHSLHPEPIAFVMPTTVKRARCP